MWGEWQPLWLESFSPDKNLCSSEERALNELLMPCVSGSDFPLLSGSKPVLLVWF